MLFSVAMAIGVTASINAQEKDKTIQKKVINSKGNPTMIVFKKSSKYNINEAKQVLLEQVGNKNHSLKKLKAENDKLGFVHEKQQQYYRGIKVEFATYTLHSRNNMVESMTGEFYPIEKNNVTPQLTNQQAFQKAINHIGAEKYLWEFPGAAKEMDNYKKPEGELLLIPGDIINKKEARLAYKFDIYATQPLSRGYIYIDAQNGEILLYNPIIKHLSDFGHTEKVNPNKTKIQKDILEDFFVSGSAQTRYNGRKTIQTTRTADGTYTLNDAARRIYTRNANNQPASGYPYVDNYTEFTDNDNNWTSAEHSANKDNAALDAHWGASKTYDYFHDTHNRNSYDGNGAEIRSYIHVGDNYDNAFWNGSVMSYGDGSSNGSEGNGRYDALTSLDIAAHEIAHAICTNTANLAYRRESGALNEGFSDIWAAAVEHFAKGNGNDANPDPAVWLIGDEIDRRENSPALRSMSNPKAKNQPDTYGGDNWKDPNCLLPFAFNDYCGVHTNSGVINHWFYLLTVGGTGKNDVDNVYRVLGIGMEKAAKIAYRLETVYLSENSTYANARTYGITAAKDLYGENSSEVISVTNAFHAIGVGDRVDDGLPDPFVYCDATEYDPTSEYIKNIKIGSINNTSGNSPLGSVSGYSDFTKISTDLSIGKSHTITIAQEWPGGAWEDGYGVWIDYNQDGDFADDGENVWLKEAFYTTKPVKGSFIVPTTAKKGKTRMRVVMRMLGNIPEPCANKDGFFGGEAEDYTVNIISKNNDTEAPSKPTNLTVSNITQTSLRLNWKASTDNVNVTKYNIYQGTTKIESSTSTSLKISGLTANTKYSFAVKAIDAAGNTSVSSNVANTITLKEISYCNSMGQKATNEWIDFVSFGGMKNRTKSNNGYGDFTSKTATVAKGKTSKILISAGFKGKAFKERWAVWIDFNQNGLFESREKVVTRFSSRATNLVANIAIPSDAVLGKTRMRVSMKRNKPQNACSKFLFGEVEDYTINITGNINGLETLADTEVLANENNSHLIIFPNPVTSIVHVELVNKNSNANYTIMNNIGQIVKFGKTNNKIDVSNLKSGIYILKIDDNSKSLIAKFIKR